MELWSLMHFLMPHVFQSHKDFKEWFSNPLSGMIEGSREYNEGLIKRLHKVSVNNCLSWVKRCFSRLIVAFGWSNFAWIWRPLNPILRSSCNCVVISCGQQYETLLKPTVRWDLSQSVVPVESDIYHCQLSILLLLKLAVYNFYMHFLFDCNYGNMITLKHPRIWKLSQVFLRMWTGTTVTTFVMFIDLVLIVYVCRFFDHFCWEDWN